MNILNKDEPLEKVQKRACKIILGKNYNSYTDAIETCELDTPSDHKKNHSGNLRNLCQIVNAQAPSFLLQGDLCKTKICVILIPLAFCLAGLNSSKRVQFLIFIDLLNNKHDKFLHLCALYFEF